jgi:hypothetical protein
MKPYAALVVVAAILVSVLAYGVHEIVTTAVSAVTVRLSK